MNIAVPVVHIIDDDTSFLTAASRLLKASGRTVQSYDSASLFLAQPADDAPGCIIVDLQMPGLNGLELQDVLARNGNTKPIIFLTGNGDIPSSVSAMRKGAEDFLTKLAPKEQLLDAVQRALERDERERAQRAKLQELRDRFHSLTPRESEVLSHVLLGKLNKQIASELTIDERSVKRHRTSFMAKLDVQSVAELARLVHEAGWPFSSIRP